MIMNMTLLQGLTSIAKNYQNDASVSHMIGNHAILFHHNMRLKILALRLRHDWGTIYIAVNWQSIMGL